MNSIFCKQLILIIIFFFTVSGFAQGQLAFPGAEGYGKYTVGGRGGEVYEVTNLDDSGPGSLRAAVEASGPRTVVFRVSGTIIQNSALTISNPYITIAGQTAPGDGICLRKYPLVVSANQVIIRYIRVRLGHESRRNLDAFTARYIKNLIVDHVSASWGDDETLTVYHCDSVTVQWCIASETLNRGGSHGFGGIWGANYSSFHHNLIAHNVSRNPRIASGCGNSDFRNNVIYNWGYQSIYGGESQQVNKPEYNFANINVVANYFKPGPATTPGEVSHCIADPWTRNGADDYGKWYIADNYMVGNAKVTANNWNGGVQPRGGSEFKKVFKLDQPWPALPINQQTAEEAYASVLENVGSILPKRDAVDARIIDETRNGYATYEGIRYEILKAVPDSSKNCGIIESHLQVGGWPELKSGTAPADSDHDGMPDDWENKNRLNKENPDDRNIVDSDGYTMLEKYLNSIK